LTKKIGIIVGRENTWPHAFIDEVNRRQAGVTAEFVKLDGTHMDEPPEYAVIIDRLSHEVPYYRTFLKTAMIGGTYVINNPFWWSADNKFVGAAIATKIGVAHPRTIALPSHSYIEGIVLP
jgi:glutathione synthase/RimK-type ligase-like ATP-grasp enzyme